MQITEAIVTKTAKQRNGKNNPMTTSNNIDEFISHLYRSAPRIAPEQYRAWALEQLSRVIEFDAAAWGTGNRSASHVLCFSHLGLDDQFAQRISETLDINPLTDSVEDNLGKPVDMSDVIPDKDFYQSDIYHRVFKPYGIKRILSSTHIDANSGLYSLLSIYRFDPEKVFSDQERELQQRLIYHLVSAGSHAFFLHLRVGQSFHLTMNQSAAAICDPQGWFHEVQPGFIALINEHFPAREMGQLPIAIPILAEDEGRVVKAGALSFTMQPQGELVFVSIRLQGPLDLLSDREKQTVELVCKGLSFKEAARSLGLAPSTVSNHLYRVYEKLGISSRTELAQLVDSQQ